MKTTIDLTCPACGTGHTASVYLGINTAEQPHLKAAVRDGSLFLWECPHCGRRNLINTQLLYHDPEQRLMVWLLPEGLLSPEKEKEVSGALQQQFAGEAGLDGYTMRRVSQAGDLIEKVNIHDAGLDDVVMEMVKWLTRRELSEKESGARAGEILRAPFRFYRMEGADNDLSLTFPLGGAMQMVPVGFNVYEDCRGIVLRNPAVRPPEKGFAVVDAAWIESFLG